MRILLSSSTIATTLLALTLGMGCGGGEVDNGSDDDGDVTPLPYEETTGQAPTEKIEYPEGPFGNEIGSVVANYKFVGFVDPSVDTESAREIQFADFYNPTGDGVYPEGSPYGAGQPKPKALLIIVSAGWCEPCKYENANYLPGDYEEYHPQGAQFLLQMADGPTLGKPAVFQNLIGWTKKYHTKWPAVIDPTNKLSPLWAQDAFPTNMIIDTRTMTIVESIAGVPEPDGPYWQTLEEVLAK